MSGLCEVKCVFNVFGQCCIKESDLPHAAIRQFPEDSEELIDLKDPVGTCPLAQVSAQPPQVVSGSDDDKTNSNSGKNGNWQPWIAHSNPDP